VPPRTTCNKCFCNMNEFVEVAPTGTLTTYTIVYARSHLSLEPPFVYGIINWTGRTADWSISSTRWTSSRSRAACGPGGLQEGKDRQHPGYPLFQAAGWLRGEVDGVLAGNRYFLLKRNGVQTCDH